LVAGHHEALFGCKRSDVARRYRAVELSTFGRLAQHCEALAVELLRDLFGLAPELEIARLELDLHRLEARAVFLGGAQRLAAGQEVVAREAVLDAYDLTHLAELGHPFEQDHFHGSLRRFVRVRLFVQVRGFGGARPAATRARMLKVASAKPRSETASSGQPRTAARAVGRA